MRLLVVNRGTNQAIANRPVAASKASALAVRPRHRRRQKVTPPRLLCRRQLTRLLRETRRISGYLTTLTVYEEARGELLKDIVAGMTAAVLWMNDRSLQPSARS